MSTAQWCKVRRCVLTHRFDHCFWPDQQTPLQRLRWEQSTTEGDTAERILNIGLWRQYLVLLDSVDICDKDALFLSALPTNEACIDEARDFNLCILPAIETPATSCLIE